jgi:hypothetical protein
LFLGAPLDFADASHLAGHPRMATADFISQLDTVNLGDLPEEIDAPPQRGVAAYPWSPLGPTLCPAWRSRSLPRSCPSILSIPDHGHQGRLDETLAAAEVGI